MLSDTVLEWQNSGDFISYQGHRVFYKVEGVGEPLLLLHGFPSASIDWQGIWPLLTSKFQLITLDMMGYGLSDKSQAFDYSIHAQTDLVVHLVEQLKLSSVHVLGHDYGDTVSQELLARHIEGALRFNLKSVTLLNGGLFPETHKPLLIQKLLMSPVGNLLAKAMTKKKFSKSLQKICSDGLTDSDIDDLWSLLQHKQGIMVVPKLIYYMQERRDYRERWVGALQQADAIALPLHLIDGVIDPISGQHLVERFRKLVPCAKVTELAGVGHYPQIEAPHQVVSAFLDGVSESFTLSKAVASV